MMRTLAFLTVALAASAATTLVRAGPIVHAIGDKRNDDSGAPDVIHSWASLGVNGSADMYTKTGLVGMVKVGHRKVGHRTGMYHVA